MKTKIAALLPVVCSLSVIACSSDDENSKDVDLGSGGLASTGGSGGDQGSGGEAASGGANASGGADTGSTGGSSDMTGGNTQGTGGIENPGGEPGGSNPATCDETNDWEDSWSQLEEDVLTLVNQVRAEGATCGTETFAPTHPLKMDPALRCAARLHSLDMVERDFFAHDNPSGENPWVRIENAGYEGNASGENIAAGSSDAAGTMNQWMNSPGHCVNIMSNANFIGVGYYPGGDYGHVWTQTFGR